MGNKAVGAGADTERHHGIHLLQLMSRRVAAEEVVVGKWRASRVPEGIDIKDQKNLTRPTIAPPDSVLYEHPTNWMWHMDDWDCYVDEAGNPYYYNAMTGESTWDPPSDLEQYQFPSYMPEQDTFPVDNPDAYPDCVEGVDGAEGLEVVDGIVATYVEEIDASSSVDIEFVWDSFAQHCSIRYDELESHRKDADNVLQEISDGNYDQDSLIMLPWAYKFHQFQVALVDCYLKGAQYSDSSKYDNCDGIPRFERGLVEWYEYTESMYASCSLNLLHKTSEEEENERTLKQMEMLESAIANASDKELLKVLQARVDELNAELEILQSRCLSIVSVEGGPTKESLDNIYFYVKDAVEGELDLCDIQDEMEEFVQNQIESRHKFLVDVILADVLNAFELDAVQARIQQLLAPQDHLALPASDSKCEGDIASLIADSVAGEVQTVMSAILQQLEDRAEAEFIGVDMGIVEAKLAAEEKALESLKQSQLKEVSFALQEMLPSKVAALVAVGFDAAEATSVVEGEIRDEEARRADAMDAEHRLELARVSAAAMLEECAAALEEAELGAGAEDALDERIERNERLLATIRAQHEVQGERLKAEVEAAHSKQLKKTREKLAKQKEQRARELVASGVPVYEAVERAGAEELEARTRAETAALRSMTEEQGRIDEALLKDFRAVEAKCASRLEVELSAKESRMRRDLADRLAARSKLGESKEDGRNDMLPNDLQGLKAKAADELAAEELKELEGKIASLRESHDIKVARLQDEILFKKSAANSSLQTRLANRKDVRAMRSAANVNQLASASKPSSHSLSSAVAVPTEITVEAFVSQLKVDHKNDLHRLKSFLSHERHVYDSNNARIAASVVIDSILTGYKKQSVYVLKLVAKKRKAENLSASERSECILEAANQMLKRYERDTKNLMETLQNERGRDVKALIDKGASKSKIVEAEQRRDVYDLDQIRKEQGKLMFALAGLSIDTELLGVASEPFKSPGDGLKFRVNSSEDLSEDGFDEDGEYDHLSTFLQRLVMWRLWVLRVEDVYSRSLPCLYSLFYAAHTKFLSGPDKDALELLSRGMFMEGFRFNLLLLGNAFIRSAAVSSSHDVSIFASGSEKEFMIGQVKSTIDEARSSGSLLKCFSKESVPEKVRREYTDALSRYFQSPVFSVGNVQDLYNLLVKPCTPERTQADQLRSEAIKSLGALVVKRRKEVLDLLKGAAGAVEEALQKESAGLDSALSAIEQQILESEIDHSKVTPEALMTALRALAVGGAPPTNDSLAAIQKSLQTASEQREVQRILNMQAQSAEKLDMTMQLQKVKEKQALQNKLMQRKAKNK